MSDEVVSLFALMDAHLSKTKLNEEITEKDEKIDDNTPSSSSDRPAVPGPKLAIPQFFPGNSPIKDFLAKQISNTLKAKEIRKKQEQDHQKLEEQMRRLKIEEKEKIRLEHELTKIRLKEEQEFLIDLTSAIIPPVKSSKPTLQCAPKAAKFNNAPGNKIALVREPSKGPLIFDKETCLYKPWDLTLPCTTDMSYILKKKMKREKFSNFGKVFCSKFRPVHHILIPFKHEMTNSNVLKINFKTKYSGNKTVTVPMGPTVDESNIIRFDFSTKSPGDIYVEQKRAQEENERKPKMSTRFVPDIMDFID